MKKLLTIILILATFQTFASVRGDVLRNIQNDKVSKFINSIWVDTKYIAEKYELPQGLLISMACLESGYGSSRLAKEQNNLLGIKYNHKYATFYTRLDCFEAWAKVLNQECYKELEFNTIGGWLYQLDYCGYHQSETYSKKIKWIYYKFGLDKCDD